MMASWGGTAWLELKCPSEFKVQDEYGENRDQKVYLVSCEY